MNRICTILLLCVTAAACTERDPVERLVVRLSGNHGLFMNGIFQPIRLPVAASPQDVTKKLFETIREKGDTDDYEILKTKEVMIMGEAYTAVTLRTVTGMKILLLKRPLQDSSGWWHRFYSTDESTWPGGK
jgi:hypothetical protein